MRGGLDLTSAVQGGDEGSEMNGRSPKEQTHCYRVTPDTIIEYSHEERFTMCMCSPHQYKSEDAFHLIPQMRAFPKFLLLIPHLCSYAVHVVSRPIETHGKKHI